MVGHRIITISTACVARARARPAGVRNRIEGKLNGIEIVGRISMIDRLAAQGRLRRNDQTLA
jgi:hypothetical protein